MLIILWSFSCSPLSQALEELGITYVERNVMGHVIEECDGCFLTIVTKELSEPDLENPDVQAIVDAPQAVIITQVWAVVWGGGVMMGILLKRVVFVVVAMLGGCGWRIMSLGWECVEWVITGTVGVAI